MRNFKDTDLPVLNRWLTRHGHPALPRNVLGKLGWVVPGVACGFILEIENGTLILDGIASNSLCSSATRHRALDAIFAQAIKFANGRKLLGISQNGETIVRAQRHGFTPIPHLLLALET